MLAEFYYPAYTHDFPVLAPISSGATGITTQFQNISAMSADDLPAIRIAYPDGAVEYNQIVDVTEDANGNEVIALENGTTNSQQFDTAIITRLIMARMSSDTIRFDHEGIYSWATFSTIEVD